MKKKSEKSKKADELTIYIIKKSKSIERRSEKFLGIREDILK